MEERGDESVTVNKNQKQHSLRVKTKVKDIISLILSDMTPLFEGRESPDSVLSIKERTSFRRPSLRREVPPCEEVLLTP